MAWLHLIGLAASNSIKHGRGTRILREGISRWIILGFTDGNVLNFSVFGVNGVTLATSDDTDRGRTGMGHLNIKSLAEFTSGITHEFDHGSFDTLVNTPSGHDSTIVDTPDDDFIDPGFLEGVLSLKVSRDLCTGSRGSESAGKTDHDNVLILNVVGNIDHVRGESRVKVHRRNLFTNLGSKGKGWEASGCRRAQKSERC